MPTGLRGGGDAHSVKAFGALQVEARRVRTEPKDLPGKKIERSPIAQGVSKPGEFTALSQNTCRRGEVQKSCVHSKLMPYKRTMVHTNFIVQNSNLEIVMMSTPLRVDDFSV